jgi:hypothetical protein
MPMSLKQSQASSPYAFIYVEDNICRCCTTIIKMLMQPVFHHHHLSPKPQKQLSSSFLAFAFIKSAIS